MNLFEIQCILLALHWIWCLLAIRDQSVLWSCSKFFSVGITKLMMQNIKTHTNGVPWMKIVNKTSFDYTVNELRTPPSAISVFYTKSIIFEENVWLVSYFFFGHRIENWFTVKPSFSKLFEMCRNVYYLSCCFCYDR